MAKKLGQTFDRSTLLKFHRKAIFELQPEQDFDELKLGQLFTAWVDAGTAATLKDPNILSRKKLLYFKVGKNEYRPYCHPETAQAGESYKAKRLPSRIEDRSDGRYQVTYVNPVTMVQEVAEPLPDWAVEFLEDAAYGYADDRTFERMMWDLIISPDQKAYLNQHNISLNCLSEGRYDGSHCDQIYKFYEDWNAKLGEQFWGG